VPAARPETTAHAGGSYQADARDGRRVPRRSNGVPGDRLAITRLACRPAAPTAGALPRPLEADAAARSGPRPHGSVARARGPRRQASRCSPPSPDDRAAHPRRPRFPTTALLTRARAGSSSRSGSSSGGKTPLTSATRRRLRPRLRGPSRTRSTATLEPTMSAAGSTRPSACGAPGLQPRRCSSDSDSAAASPAWHAVSLRVAPQRSNLGRFGGAEPGKSDGNRELRRAACPGSMSPHDHAVGSHQGEHQPVPRAHRRCAGKPVRKSRPPRPRALGPAEAPHKAELP